MSDNNSDDDSGGGGKKVKVTTRVFTVRNLQELIETLEREMGAEMVPEEMRAQLAAAMQPRPKKPWSEEEVIRGLRELGEDLPTDEAELVKWYDLIGNPGGQAEQEIIDSMKEYFVEVPELRAAELIADMRRRHRQ